jgi:RNA polymerase sigma-70 factor, ECF subfamily
MECSQDQQIIMESPEKAWLLEYRHGRVDAMGELMEHFRRPLFGFILKMTEGREDAEEIFQEVWLRVIRNQESYQDKKFLSWLFRIAHNLIVDRARKFKPIRDFPSSESDPESEIETRIPSPDISPALQVEGRDLGRRISTAVSRLPQEQKEVFLMRMEGDLPFKEIAKIQGTSINTALARMQYALVKLRDELKTDYRDIAGEQP